MKLSTKVRYGTRAMLEMALVYPDESVSVKEMAKRQDLSVKYLEQIMAALKAVGLVRSARGFRGGYTLSQSPAFVKLGDIFRTLDGPLRLADCLDDPAGCPMSGECAARDVWLELQGALEKVLDGTTLQDLADRKRAKTADAPSAFQI